ncbi:MAG TPA: hypothetical protein VGF13_06670, partial [Verrucomicrobiae bacterium]
MKKIILTMAMAACTTVLPAASLNVIDVTASNITCMLSTNCTAPLSDTTDSIHLPNSTGEGYLQTRTIRGLPGSLGEGLWSYLYRIDLTGVTALNSNLQSCFTNVVRCGTNKINVETNVVVCRTNVTLATNKFVCVTNHFPSSQTVFCFTNTIPATNIVRCTTNSAGATVCFTNFFPGTNFVTCFTNTVAATNLVFCQFTNLPAATNLVCTTNRISYSTNVYGCVTNTVPCPGVTPCIESFRIRFGPSLSLNANGSNGPSTGQVFVVTAGGTGTVAVVSVNQTGSVVTIHFASPICPGSSSLYFGLVSSNAPHEVDAVLKLNSGASLEADARAPSLKHAPIRCDFNALRDAIQQLGANDLLAPNDRAREGRRGSLLNAVKEAGEQAEDGDLGDTLDELDELIERVGDSKWFSPQAANQ